MLPLHIPALLKAQVNTVRQPESATQASSDVTQAVIGETPPVVVLVPPKPVLPPTYVKWEPPVLGFPPIEVEYEPVSYTHLRAHETVLDLVCRLLLEKNK